MSQPLGPGPFRSARRRPIQVQVAGERAGWPSGQLGQVRGAGPVGTEHLVPYFDPFVVGSHPRHRWFPVPAAIHALPPSGQAGNHAVVLIDGEVTGVRHPAGSEGGPS